MPSRYRRLHRATYSYYSNGQYQEHTRHRIKDCDYPGVIPYAKSRNLFDHDLTREERSVRGNLVAGLSKEDIELLDVFEGDEYVREKVQVHLLGSIEPLNNPSGAIVSSTSAPLPVDLGEPVDTEVYIWSAPTTFLVPELWSYEVFIRDNAWKWVGPAETKESYAEVDRRRQMNGIITRAAEYVTEDSVVN
ncbi:hypothetical protein EW145_g7570 [Phellinidium pouzarii]|uniref:Putative gamma-glutamylcyclotransferase n=1 Tax=Phellinidium pouzarii TaxID=167371 RepID=A0A4S4KI61_9AGAM|nr:hypothetical protein EW145_g7570 [Phellinidium pouzarii]